jgi:hypothetical protein
MPAQAKARRTNLAPKTATTSTFASTPPQPQHLKEIGFKSIKDYRLWCLRYGLEDGAPAPNRARVRRAD